MQQSLEREIRAIHAWAKLAPGTKKEVDGDQQHVDYTLVVDGIKLAVVITTKANKITARELAILDNYKTGGIWKFAYILHITPTEVRYQEINAVTGSILKGNTIIPDISTFKSIQYE
jgi:hypothetical protein